jgi:hypothetical protein
MFNLRQFQFLGVIGVFTVLLITPWTIQQVASPLLPVEYAQTVTAYSPTEHYSFTATAQQEQDAPSSMCGFNDLGTCVPLGSQSNPATSDGVEVASANGVILNTNVITQTGVSVQVLNTVSSYSCPDRIFPLGTSVQIAPSYPVLAWSANGSDLFLQMQQNPPIWILVDANTIVTPTQFQATGLPFLPPACVASGQAQVAATSTIPLPVARTSTPLPAIPLTIRLTSEEASLLVEASSELQNPQVFFAPELLRVTGQVTRIVLGRNVSSEVEITGTLQTAVDPSTNHRKLIFVVATVTVANRELADQDAREVIEANINNLLRQQLIRSDVQGFRLEENTLIIDVLRYPLQGEVFPPTPDATQLALTEQAVIPTVTPLPGDYLDAVELTQTSQARPTIAQTPFPPQAINITTTRPATAATTPTASANPGIMATLAPLATSGIQLVTDVAPLFGGG